MSEISDLIVALQKSDLVAKCPRCNEASKLSEFLMWDGTAKHPDEAKKVIDAHEKGLEKANEDLDILCKFLQKENDYLHKVSTCVLETMSVAYGGDRFKTFAPTGKGAPVVETTINLAFKELELITRERIEEGY